MKLFKNIVTVLISIVLWIIILLAALFAFTTLATRDNTKVANLAGYTPLIVKSESMSPTFNAGDLILIKTCKTENLKVGDIVTFHTIIMNEYALNTHRIDAITDNEGARIYTTKGDNNDIVDSHMITDGDIVGMYVARLKGMGRVMEFLSSSVGFFIVIVLPMLLFFIYQIYHLVMVGINLKKAIAVEEAMESASAEEKLAEAEAVLAEAKRLKEEAEAKLAMANQTKEDE